VQNLRSFAEPSGRKVISVEKPVNTTHLSEHRFGADALQSVDDSTSSQYVGCNTSTCFINSNKVKSTFQNELILILGCSLDIFAIGYFCNAATGTPMDHVVYSTPFAYLASCTVGHFTVVYAFHPGASAPPYGPQYSGMESLGTSRHIISKTKHDVMVKFGREPSAIVVDASLWDVSNWWQKSGSPAWPYPIGYPFIQQWCTKDVPELLMHVAATYPNVPIAFRTAPTVFSDPNSFGLSGGTVAQMVHCIEQHKDGFGRLYGTFDVIDYHHFVENTLTQAGASAGVFYRDSLHPGAQLSLLYMNNVLTWAQGKSHLAR